MATIFRYNENKALIKAIKSWYSMAHVQNSWLIEILYWSTTHKQKDILRMRSLINYITEKTICQFGRWDLVQVEWIVSILRWISHIPHQTHTHTHTQQGDRSSQVRRYMGIITFGDSHLFSLWPYKSLCPTSNMWNCCVCVDSNICLSDGVCHSDLMFRSVWIHTNISVYQIAIDIGILFVVGQFQYNVSKGPYQ